MNVFIYDTDVNSGEHEKTLAYIETRITDLGLSGKIARLSLMKNVDDIIIDECRRGATMFVAVGGDSLVNKIINNLENCDVVVGIIPLGQENSIAQSLGIASPEEACDILAMRRVETLNIGQANNSYFISQAIITGTNIFLHIDEKYSVQLEKNGVAKVINLAPPDESYQNLPKKISPQDQTLELILETQNKKNLFKKELEQSFFSCSKLTISGEKNSQLILDNTKKISTPVEISLAAKKINFVVGKNRNF